MKSKQALQPSSNFEPHLFHMDALSLGSMHALCMPSLRCTINDRHHTYLCLEVSIISITVGMSCSTW